MRNEGESEEDLADTAQAPRDGPRTAAMAQLEVNEVMESLPASRRRGPLYAFSFRNFRLFFYGQLISVAGTWMQTVAQNWQVWDLTHSARWLGIVSGASAVPYVLFSLWGGHIADRYSRRKTLVWTQTAAMLLAFLLALLATNRPIVIQPWHIAVLAALSGLVNAFNMPAQQAFVTDMVDDPHAIGNAIALNSVRFNLARFLGPVLAGIVLSHWGAAMCYLLNALSFIAVIFSLLMMRLPDFVARTQKASVWEGFKFIRSSPGVFRTVALVGAGSFFTWSVSTLFPMIATTYGEAARGYSYLMATNGVGAALGGLFVAVFGERLVRRTLVYGGAIVFCLSLLLLSVMHTFLLVNACVVLSGFSMIVFAISANTKVQSDLPDMLRGRVMAVYTLVMGGLMPLGGLEIGFLAHQRNSAGVAIGINAGICLGISIALYVWSVLDASPARLAEKQAQNG